MGVSDTPSRTNDQVEDVVEGEHVAEGVDEEEGAEEEGAGSTSAASTAPEKQACGPVGASPGGGDPGGVSAASILPNTHEERAAGKDGALPTGRASRTATPK